ncbi:MAG TPA: hypothetical protein VGF53_02445 [Pseudolabrys sp.]|jgi:hypothetical protein
MLCLHEQCRGRRPRRDRFRPQYRFVVLQECHGAIAPEEKSSPAEIAAIAIRWPDILDGTIYTIERSTGVFKKLFEGQPLYTKQCKKLAAGANLH